MAGEQRDRTRAQKVTHASPGARLAPGMSLAAAPPPVSTNPLARLAEDLRAERRATVPFPPGDTRFSLRRTREFARRPLPILLDHYERFGPVFTIRVLHGNSVWMLGPEANHFVTVSDAAKFS